MARQSMNSQKLSPLAAALILLLAQLVPFMSRGQAPATPSAGDLPAAERLIAALPPTNGLPLPAEALALLEWPSPEVLTTTKGPEDRSKTIPPLFREPKIRDAKPIRLGAETPHAACREAMQWIRQVLKPEWVPADLGARLHALQREPASQSIIVCRYTIDGCAIQISQTRSVMSVVVRPPKGALPGQNAEQFARSVFTNCFLQGDRMASLPAKEAARFGAVQAWLPNFSPSTSPSVLENWWGWRLWLTDGKAVAVLLRKISEDSAYTPAPDEPWF
jgi:hypothetical protein